MKIYLTGFDLVFFNCIIYVKPLLQKLHCIKSKLIFLWHIIYVLLHPRIAVKNPGGSRVNRHLPAQSSRIKTRLKIRSKITMKAPERHHWHHSGVLIVHTEHTPHSALMSLLYQTRNCRMGRKPSRSNYNKIVVIYSKSKK